MVQDLNLVGYQYNIAAAVFFLLYSAAEIPRYGWPEPTAWKALSQIARYK